MPLEGMFLGQWCDGPAGICTNCVECISTHKDRAFERLCNFLYPSFLKDQQTFVDLCETFRCYG